MRLSRSRRQSTFCYFTALPLGCHRFSLLGIALLVYFFALRSGIFLFAVEIIWFIGRPVYAEMSGGGRDVHVFNERANASYYPCISRPAYRCIRSLANNRFRTCGSESA